MIQVTTSQAEEATARSPNFISKRSIVYLNPSSLIFQI